MKKIYSLFYIIVFTATIATAQKDNRGVLAPHKEIILSNLPDLTFDLVPVIANGGNNYEMTASAPGQVRVKVSFIVKNIGLGNAAPAQVYAEYSFLGTQRVGSEIKTSLRHVQSGQVSIPAIEKGKDLLIEKREFVFDTTPEQAYGKELKFRLAIVTTGTGSQKEHSIKNNVSQEVILNINR